jgi:hypothetical protein
MESKIEIKNGKVVGYEFGKSISIHEHVNDPEGWFVTIRPLQIFGQSLCKKDCTQEEIARYVNVLLHKKLNTVNELIKDITPFTSKE